MESTNVSPVAETESTGITAEQAFELERVRLERVQTERELLQAKESHQRAEAEHAELIRAQAHRDAINASGVRFYENAIAEKLTAEFDVRVDAEGVATGVVDGKRVPLERVYQAVAKRWPTIADGRSTRNLKPDTGEMKAKSKADFPTMHAKMSFIDEHGLEAWERLPMRSARVVEVRTFSDYVSLPQSAKLELISKHGADWVGRLPRN